MTWSISATLAASTMTDAMREAIDSHISAMPSWSVATPSSATSDRNLQYNMGSKNIFSRTTIEYYFSNTYGKINGHYNQNSSATWQEHASTGVSGGMAMSNPGAGQTYKFWTSSLLPDSFMIITAQGRVVWGWIEYQQYMIIGDPAYLTTAAAMNYTAPYGFVSGAMYCGGLPGQDQYGYSTPYWAGFDLDFQPTQDYPSAASGTVDGTVVQGFRATQSGNTTLTNDKLFSVGVVNTADVLLHLGSASGNIIPSGSLQKMTDGTNWYLRTSPNLSHTAILFPVGTSEPTF